MHYLDSVVLVLAIAVVTVILCRRFHIPSMLGYLVVGFIAGPGVMRLIPQTPATDFLGEIGIVFLMFSIGLEFSLSHLRSMKKMVLGLGLSQVLITMLVIVAIGFLLNIHWISSLALAGALMVSSTAIVSRLMSESGDLGKKHGQMSMGVLLMQDIAVVPIMILMHSVAGDTATLWQDLAFAMLKMAVVLVVMLYLGEKLMRPWFSLVAKQEQSELFMLNVLLVTLGVAYLTELAGLSLALGAFVAGMLIAETQYRFQVEDDIRPFRDVLLGFFFITIGMKMDISILVQNYGKILSFLFLLIFVKALIVYLVSVKQKYDKKNGFQAALYLAQGGEFGFVLLALALKDSLIQEETVQIGTAAILLSMIVAPFIIRAAPWLTNKIFKSAWDEKSVDLHAVLVENMGKNDHVILVGFGHAGQTVARLLKKEGIAYYVLDLDAERVQAARLAGEPIAYGDAKRKDILLAAGLNRARLVLLSTHSMSANEHVLSTIMSIKPSLPVIVRTDRDENIEFLCNQGAGSVVSDDQEIGLVLASEAMLNFDMPFQQVYNIIREVRQDQYDILKGQYLGSDEMVDAQDAKNIYRDSILLTHGADAIGKHPKSLPFVRLKIGLLGLRRGVSRIDDFPEDFIMQENDVMMVVGLPAAICELKEIVLQGKD